MLRRLFFWLRVDYCWKIRHVNIFRHVYWMHGGPLKTRKTLYRNAQLIAYWWRLLWMVPKPEIQCKCHKYSLWKEYFFKEICSTRNIRKYWFKKKSVLKFQDFLDLENGMFSFVFHFLNVWMKPEVPYYNIFMNL